MLYSRCSVSSYVCTTMMMPPNSQVYGYRALWWPLRSGSHFLWPINSRGHYSSDGLHRQTDYNHFRMDYGLYATVKEISHLMICIYPMFSSQLISYVDPKEPTTTVEHPACTPQA